MFLTDKNLIKNHHQISRVEKKTFCTNNIIINNCTQNKLNSRGPRAEFPITRSGTCECVRSLLSLFLSRGARRGFANINQVESLGEQIHNLFPEDILGTGEVVNRANSLRRISVWFYSLSADVALRGKNWHEFEENTCLQNIHLTCFKCLRHFLFSKAVFMVQK